MRGFPPELIYVLIFIGALLVQYLLKLRASRQPPGPAQDERAEQAAHEMWAESAELQRAAAAAWPQPRPSTGQRAAAPAAHPAPARRRFARQSLMETRRDLQNAIVVATILEPCRALQPPRTEPAPRGSHQGRAREQRAQTAPAPTGHP